MSSESNSDSESNSIENRDRSRSPLTRNILQNDNFVFFDNSNTSINMALAPNFKVEYLQMIPEFTGNQALLTEFITNSEDLIAQFYVPQDPDCFSNKFLLKSIKTKIKGDAAKNISSYSVLTWDDLKNALLASYSDKRDLQTLKIEMCNMKQGNLKPLEFYSNIQNSMNLQISFINIHFQEPSKTVLTDDSQKLALRVFLKHLNNPLGDYLSTRKPNSLSEALHILTNDFNITEKINQSVKPNQVRPIIPPKFITPHVQTPRPFQQNLQNTNQAGPSRQAK